MTIKKALWAVLVAVMLTPWSASYGARYDVLELPAVPSELASTSLIFTVRKFDDRYFAVGHRGHILYSDDGGDSWTQAEVPVRSSLLDIHFPTPELGWAVGHEGVILHSTDGGKTWVKQYDGIRYGEEGLAFYQKLVNENPDNELYPYLVEEMEFAISQGADKPVFKVYFHDENWGYALGAYGMALITRDGGDNWQHLLHTMENDSFFHIFDFAPLPEEGKFFLSGEAGLFLIADINEETASQIQSMPWEGSFFTSSDTGNGAIIMGGLRGRMFRTEDVGHNWTVVEKPETSSMVDSTRLANGNLVFVSIAGAILISTDDGNSFTKLPLSIGGRIYSVAEGPQNTLLVAGPSGIHKLSLPQ
jgi:photosystem II stability/assembly factor-like uncharacterized protein